MISKSILFYWSKGAELRRKIIRLVKSCEEKNKPCFLNSLAKELKITHVAVKKHLDLLLEEEYVEPLNPKGKPIYLKLTKAGNELHKEFIDSK